jgi:hypothetical protein
MIHSKTTTPVQQLVNGHPKKAHGWKHTPDTITLFLQENGDQHGANDQKREHYWLIFAAHFPISKV